MFKLGDKAVWQNVPHMRELEGTTCEIVKGLYVMTKDKTAQSCRLYVVKTYSGKRMVAKEHQLRPFGISYAVYAWAHNKVNDLIEKCKNKKLL